MVSIVSIIIILCEILAIVILWTTINSKKEVTKDSLIHLVPCFLFGYILHGMCLCKEIISNEINFFDIIIKGFECIHYTVQSFACFPQTKVVATLAGNCWFCIAYSIYLIYITAVMSYNLIAILGGSINNFVCRVIKFFKNCDVIIYTGKKSEDYVKSNANSVLWIDSDLYTITKEKKKYFQSNNIIYYVSKIDKQNVENVINVRNLFVKDETHIILFYDGKVLYREYISIFSNLNINKKGKLILHLETKDEHVEFVHNQVKSINFSNSNVTIDCFTLYELMARKFIQENAFVLPDGFLDKNCCLNKEKEINIVLLGFGHVNRALLKAMISNYQFVGFENGEFKERPINYYVYDRDGKVFKTDDLLHRLKLQMDKDEMKTGDEIERFNVICNIKDEEIDIDENEISSKIRGLINDNSYTMIFVSVSDDVENYSKCLKFVHMLKEKADTKFTIFCNMDEDTESVLYTSEKNIQFYGQKSKILTHDVIVNGSLLDLAKVCNEQYQKKRFMSIDWYQLSFMKRYSNLYAALNVRFKLNLMGLDIVSKASEDDKKEAKLHYTKMYLIPTEEDTREKQLHSYMELNVRNVLARVEHLRWCAFYFVNGFDTMKLSKIKYDNNKGIYNTKDEGIKKEHCCLTTYEGLEIVNEYIILEGNKEGHKQQWKEIETYRYDYTTMDNLYSYFDKNKDYQIVKIRAQTKDS